MTRVQCPHCLARVRVKADGTMYSHGRGRPGALKECPGSGCNREDAKKAKASGVPVTHYSVEPEDIF